MVFEHFGRQVHKNNPLTIREPKDDGILGDRESQLCQNAIEICNKRLLNWRVVFLYINSRNNTSENHSEIIALCFIEKFEKPLI